MSLPTKIILLLYIVLNFAYNVTPEPIVPCDSNDTNCLIKLLGNVHKNIEQDHLVIHDIVINIPDIEFNISDGVLNGLDTCEYIDARIDLENGNGSVVVKCNLVSRGIYNAIIWKPKSIGVNVINHLKCDGPYELSMLNTTIKYNVKLVVIKSDGNFHLQFDDGSVEYNVNNKDHKVVYTLAGVLAGGEDVTKSFNKAINKNWKPVSTMIVNPILKSIIGPIAEPMLRYLSKMPFGSILTNDVTKYAKEANNKRFLPYEKCSIKDTSCQLELIRNIKAAVSRGIPELNIPKLDELILKNMTVQLPELMDFTLIEGSINGVDKCTFKSAKFDFDSKKFTIEQYCDLTIKGIYVAYLYANATLSTFGGRNVDAHGNTEVTLVKLPLNANYEVTLNKKENDYIYLSFKDVNINYDFNEPGHSISFKLDGVQLGSLDISEIAMNILNDNWQFFAPDFGPTFILEITKRINEPLLNFLSNISTKQYFVESLNSYVF